jgi:hypothetical protein
VPCDASLSPGKRVLVEKGDIHGLVVRQ